jgi:hypothetical protein
MAQFMLLLHENPHQFAGLSQKELLAVIEEYRAWGQRLAAEGKLVASHKLTDEGGRHLQKRGSEILMTDGPFAEAKEVLGGYYIVNAASYDEAVGIAKTGPHLRYNGRIEVRKVDLVD